MKADIFEADITPPIGGYLTGFAGRNKVSEGVTDPLFLRILALEDEKGERVVFVTADILEFSVDMSWRIKTWAERNLGIKSSAVILNSSHTHCGPLLSPQAYDPTWAVDIDYVEKLERSICEGIEKTVNNLVPSSLKFGIFQSHFGINRRLPKPDGVGVKWGPYEGGYYDPDIPILAIYEEDGEKLRGLLYSYACHPTSRGGYNISADYPGAVSRGLKRELGDDVCTIFAQGAGGNIKPRFYDKEKKVFSSVTVDELEDFGQSIAGEIVSNLQSDEMRVISLDFASAEKEFRIPFDMEKVPDAETLRNMCDVKNNIVEQKPADRVRRIWARKMLEDIRTNSLEKDYFMHVTKIKLNNDIHVIGMCGEITAEVGRTIKDLYRDKSIVFLGYCSSAPTYIPSSKMIAEGGYEGEGIKIYASHPAPFVTEIDDIIKKEVSSLEV